MKYFLINKHGVSTLSLGKFFAAIIMTFIVQVTVNAAPTTWFVSTSGNDSNTCAQAQSSGTAKRTITAGLACIGPAGSEAGAGHTLQVSAGTYNESIVNIIPSGSSSSAKFTFKCATIGACTISSPLNAFNIGFETPSHYVVVQGFVVTGGGGYMSGRSANRHHHIEWLNNDFVDLPWGMGIQGTGAVNISIIGNRFHHIGYECQMGIGYCHGIYPSDYTDDWIISQNSIYDVSGYGIHVYPGTIDGMSNRFLVERNDIHNNTAAGIIMYGYDHVIKNNLAYSNGYEGILLRAVGGNSIFNNTTFQNRGAGIIMESGVSTACKNNLAIGDGGPEISGCTTTGNNVTTGTAASHFVSSSSSNFALMSGSTAVGTGANLSVADDFTGTARRTPSDVGAYQLASSAPAVDTVAPTPGNGGLLTGITQ